MRLEIRDFDIFRKITERRIHVFKITRIWIKIWEEINEKIIETFPNKEIAKLT